MEGYGYIKYVPDSDIIYIRLRPGEIATTVDRANDCILIDLDHQGLPLGIEIIGASKLPTATTFKVFEEFGIHVEPRHLLPA